MPVSAPKTADDRNGPGAAPARRPAGRRTQAERRDQSIRSTIAAAIEIIGESGVAAATFETIGARAGYSRGLASAHFGSKQGLIEAVLHDLDDQSAVEVFNRRLIGLSGLPALLGYIDAAFAAARTTRARAYFTLLAANLAETDPHHALFAQTHRRKLDWLAEQIAAGQAAGEIRPGIDPEGGALLVATIVVGLAMQLMVDPATRIETLHQTALATLRSAFAA
ncbi:TetR/AcrR family transcriptional regulator [Novosphingobium bradum]|uniref:TetR/AcrR family transcriptional regulator n=1 Tax=Novosphingobium bradum TaxID=1737444 RepID=A0ABV7IJG4_9SPHN